MSRAELEPRQEVKLGIERVQACTR